MKLSDDAKIFIGIALFTILIVVGGVVVLSKQQTVQQEQQSKVYNKSDLIAADSWSRGNKEARVWIVEFSDFQCPACGAIQPVIQQVLNSYKDKILFVYRNYPLPAHKFAQNAGLAAEAAGEQGKFWDYHDKLFANQAAWSSESDPSKTFIQYAKDIGLDTDKFTRSLNEKKGAAHIQEDVNAGNNVGITATPTFFINGTRFDGGLSFDQFKTEIDKRL